MYCTHSGVVMTARSGTMTSTITPLSIKRLTNHFMCYSCWPCIFVSLLFMLALLICLIARIKQFNYYICFSSNSLTIYVLLQSVYFKTPGWAKYLGHLDRGLSLVASYLDGKRLMSRLMSVPYNAYRISASLVCCLIRYIDLQLCKYRYLYLVSAHTNDNLGGKRHLSAVYVYMFMFVFNHMTYVSSECMLIVCSLATAATLIETVFVLYFLMSNSQWAVCSKPTATASSIFDIVTDSYMSKMYALQMYPGLRSMSISHKCAIVS